MDYEIAQKLAAQVRRGKVESLGDIPYTRLVLDPGGYQALLAYRVAPETDVPTFHGVAVRVDPNCTRPYFEDANGRRSYVAGA